MFGATFQAADFQTGTGYGNVRFELFVQETPSGTALPVSAEEVAGVIRDLLQSRGWTISQFNGTVGAPLDWPETGTADAH